MSPKRKPIVQGADTVAVAYLRLSPGERQSGKGSLAAGVEAQRSEIERWAAQNGVTIAAWHDDIDTSGESGSVETPLADRPGLMAALEAINSVKAGVLLVQKRDRLARDAMLAAMVTRLVERQGAKIVTANGTGNGDGPEAALMRGMIDLFAQYELALIRTRTKAALAVKQRRGERTGSVPLGSRLREDGQHVGRHRDNREHLKTCAGCLNLEADKHEQEAIALARRLVADGRSLRATAADLEAAGHLARNGRRYDAMAVSRMVEREPAARSR